MLNRILSESLSQQKKTGSRHQTLYLYQFELNMTHTLSKHMPSGGRDRRMVAADGLAPIAWYLFKPGNQQPVMLTYIGQHQDQFVPGVIYVMITLKCGVKYYQLEGIYIRDQSLIVRRTISMALLTHCMERNMMTSPNRNIFRVTGPLCGEFTGHRWIPITKASDVELWDFVSCVPEETVEQTTGRLVIWNAVALIMTSL